MTDLADLSLVEAAEAVRAATRPRWSCSTPAGATWRRPIRRLNATIWLDREGAEQAARAADRALREKAWLGPLHGVPMMHKDMYYQAGRLSTCGSALRRDWRPAVTATVIERLSAAGAYVFGGLNMAEFAQNPTGHNRAFGDCHNPWNPPYITGGSSSGSGASVAARFNYMALGSDTGGSIRLPAAACGVTGIKPTQTRVSRYGVMPLSFSADNVGPLTRTARDCARVLTLIAGRDPRDPDQFARAGAGLRGGARRRHPRACASACPRHGSSTSVDPPVLEAMERAVAVLVARGADGAADRPAADGCGHHLWQHRLARRGGDDPRAVDARAARRLRHPYQRPDVRRLRHSGDLLCRGAEPARPDPEGVRRGGVRQGRCADLADHPHLPADAGRDRHRPRPAGHRGDVHGGLVATRGRTTTWVCRRSA